jgi:hypothetical protein
MIAATNHAHGVAHLRTAIRDGKGATDIESGQAHQQCKEGKTLFTTLSLAESISIPT